PSPQRRPSRRPEAMQNLRDKLLKAGLVKKKDKKRADHNARQKRARVGGHVIEQEAREKRDELYNQKLEEQRERDRVLEEKRRKAREEREAHLRAQHIVHYYGLALKRGRRRWYFMARNRKTRHIDVTDDDARRLTRGQLAIVERIGD